MLITANNIQVCYGKKIALNDFCFEMVQGETVAILGPNGSGKTTFFRLLLGLLKQKEGRIEIMDGLPGVRSSLAMIGATIEMPSLYGHLSAIENLQATSHRRCIEPSKHLADLVDEVGLSDVGKLPASKYSLGMRQRLALAQALIGEPELLILDEPANGLDPAGIRWFREWALNAPASRKLSILFSSHILNEAAQIANKVVLLKDGKDRFMGTLDELKGPNHQLRLVTSDIPRSQELLHSNGFKATIENNALLVDCEPEQSAAITRIIFESGYDLLECVRLDSTLEDRYFAIMGEAS
ncbi:MAG: ABC transporter ATP-binding protein [Holophagaceae bacterium]|nr:ABC transporter ATP-binding protein [Holophagaceae bacterium]